MNWSWLGRGYSGLCLKPWFCLWNHPAVFFSAKTAFPQIWDMPIFTKCVFCQKLDLWVITKFKIGAKAQPGSPLSSFLMRFGAPAVKLFHIRVTSSTSGQWPDAQSVPACASMFGGKNARSHRSQGGPIWKRDRENKMDLARGAQGRSVEDPDAEGRVAR